MLARRLSLKPRSTILFIISFELAAAILDRYGFKFYLVSATFTTNSLSMT